MIIQHNMNAVTANNRLKDTKGQLHTSSEKLASGYRVNSSADDAAALKISEKMRSLVRGMNRASDNIGEGMELIEVGEGALNEVHQMLQRLVELTVQAANDTNNVEDRDAIQQEINQIKNEINRISTDTEYNEIKIFQPPVRTKSNSAPKDFLVYHEDCPKSVDARGWREGGIVYCGERYSYEALGLDFAGNIPEGSYEVSVKGEDGNPLKIELLFDGDSRIPSGRRYKPQADPAGIRIDNILHPWNTIKNEYGQSLNPNNTLEGSYSFEHGGCKFTFDIEGGMNYPTLVQWVQEDLTKLYDFRTDGMKITEVDVMPEIGITTDNGNPIVITPALAPFIAGTTTGNTGQYGMEVTDDGIRLIMIDRVDPNKDNNGKFSEMLWDKPELDLDEWENGESVNPDSTITGGEVLENYQYKDIGFTHTIIDFKLDSEVSFEEVKNAIKNWSIWVKTNSKMEIENTVSGSGITASIPAGSPLHAYGTQYNMGLIPDRANLTLAKDTPIIGAGDALTFSMTDANGKTYQLHAGKTLSGIKAEAEADAKTYIEAYRKYLEDVANNNPYASMPGEVSTKSIAYKSSEGYQVNIGYQEEFDKLNIDASMFDIEQVPSPTPTEPDRMKWQVKLKDTVNVDTIAENFSAEIEQSLRDVRFTIWPTPAEIEAEFHIATNTKTTNVSYSSCIKTQSMGLKIQSSDKVGEHITIPLPGMDTEILGIDDITVGSYDEASESIRKIHKAVNILSEIRSDFGAIHNRLGAAMMVDDVIAENSQAAESIIRDTDYGKGTVEHTKNSILEQMQEAVFAQANHTKDGVMTLLQG